jgi:heat shock protein HtpX
MWMRHAWRNRLQSLLLLLVMGGFLALLGWLLWGGSGIVMLLMMGILAVLLNPSLSPNWVMRLYGAVPITVEQAPRLWALLSGLAGRAGLENVPVLYYVPSRMLNAFAVGSRDQAAIAVTDGLVRQLNSRELSGVLAHEISHVLSNDLWVMGIADLFSRATSLLSLTGQFLLLLNLPLLMFSGVTINWFAILLLIFAPTLSALAQLALSRTREYDADLNAVRLTGDPDGMASALLKIERVQGRWLEQIILPGRKVPDPSLLRTHPGTRHRIERLMALKPVLSRQGLLPVGSGRFPVDAGVGSTVVRPPRWHISGLWH